LRTDSQTSGTAFQHLDSIANLTAEKKKTKKESPRFAFLKMTFADTHLAHLPLPPTTQTNHRGKAKRAKYSKPSKK
jgi:hypothetical protein